LGQDQSPEKSLLPARTARRARLEMRRQNGMVPALKAKARRQLHSRLAHSLRAQRGKVTAWESGVFPDRLRLPV
jgi:hypothetical protein